MHLLDGLHGIDFGEERARLVLVRGDEPFLLVYVDTHGADVALDTLRGLHDARLCALDRGLEREDLLSRATLGEKGSEAGTQTWRSMRTLDSAVSAFWTRSAS